tara:strand:+ start:460 stop:1068 length:609 start_codon:yes stop_codon:yes gene_type:complete
MIDLILDDCMNVMKKYDDNHFDLAIVDPPYGLGSKVVNSGGRFKRYENKNGNWDNAIPDKEYFDELFRVSENQIIWGGNYFGLPPNRCFLIWDKKQPQGVSFASCEYAWTSFDKTAKTFYKSPQNQTIRFHPTQKPVKLYEWLLHNYAEKGQKILDTHLGSGSIAVASHYFGVDLVGIEIDEEYYNKAKERINELTKQKSLF